MIRIRPFLNSDVPALTEIWRKQPPRRALVQPLTPTILENSVFSKPYFDRSKLLLAVEADLPIGFVHVAFGASDDRSTLSRSAGVIAMLMVVPRPDAAAVAGELLAAAESILVQGGATSSIAIGVAPRDPFYHGLYGGVLLPGVLESDAALVEWFRAAGYEQHGRINVLQARLVSFRPLVNRQQMQVRRQFQLNSSLDPITSTWWDACTIGQINRTRFTLSARGGPPVATVEYGEIEPLGSSWGVHAVGVLRLQVDADRRQAGLATFLVSESLKQLQSQGVTLAEVHVGESDEVANRLFTKLGFQQVDRGLILEKNL